MPCTGGCPFQYLNYKKSAKARARIDLQHIMFRMLWNNTEKVIKEAREVGACVANEWPTPCSYWRREEVRRLVELYKLEKTTFHGCQYGLVSIRKATLGMPILKSWTVATNCFPLTQELNRTCLGDYQKGYHDEFTRHAICEGDDTKRSEEYTDEIVQCVHRTHRTHLNISHP